MRFTSIKTNKDNKLQVGVHDHTWFLERFIKETNGYYITNFRRHLDSAGSPNFYRFIDEIPRVCVAGVFKRTELNDLMLTDFNGLVVLEVRQLAGMQECEAVKQQAMLLPSTWAAFIGASGHTVKILVSVEPENAPLPQNEAEAEDFYVQAYHQLLPVYDAQLGRNVTRMQPRLRHTFLMPFDEHPLVNEKAVAIRIKPAMASTTAPDETEQHLLALPETPRDHREVDMELYQIHCQRYANAAAKAVEQLSGIRQHSNEWWQAFLPCVLTQLCQGGMGEEEAVCVVWNKLRYKQLPVLTEELIRSVAEAVYADTKRTPGQQPQDAGQLMRNLIRRIETRYVLRHNTIMGYPEYRPNHTWVTPWQPVTDEVINTFTTDLMLAGQKVWDRDVRRYIFSTRVPRFNPIEDYLWRCRGKWDGKDRIRALAATVPTTNPAQWAEWFHTWFLAMVAQWMGRNQRYGNAVVPLLVSRQGMHKSTFCRNLLPQELRVWGYTDNLSLAEEKPVHLAMSQMLLINLDEFNRISPQKQQGFLKNILQLPSVKVKRPYARHTEEVPRLASFIATTNLPDVLYDPSGSRRFIGVQVTSAIDVSRVPNHEQLFAQALKELDNGARCWFDEQETADIMQHNRQFQQMPEALLFFLEHFEPGSPEQGEWMTVAAIMEELKKRAGTAFKPKALNAFGRALNGCEGLLHKHTRSGETYWVQNKFKP